MPSRGGPPDSSSDSGIRALAKFVFQPRVEKWTPESAAADGTPAGVAAGGAIGGAPDVETGASLSAAPGGLEQAATPMRTTSPTAAGIGAQRTDSVGTSIVGPSRCR